jgi:hypothetical protein
VGVCVCVWPSEPSRAHRTSTQLGPLSSNKLEHDLDMIELIQQLIIYPTRTESIWNFFLRHRAPSNKFELSWIYLIWECSQIPNTLRKYYWCWSIIFGCNIFHVCMKKGGHINSKCCWCAVYRCHIFIILQVLGSSDASDAYLYLRFDLVVVRI